MQYVTHPTGHPTKAGISVPSYKWEQLVGTPDATIRAYWSDGTSTVYPVGKIAKHAYIHRDGYYVVNRFSLELALSETEEDTAVNGTVMFEHMLDGKNRSLPTLNAIKKAYGASRVDIQDVTDSLARVRYLK